LTLTDKDSSELPAGAPVAAASGPAAIIYVCITCRGPGGAEIRPLPGEILAAATASAALGSGVEVRAVRCLANCARGPSAAVRANGAATSWTYIFGGLDLAAADALIQGARLLADAADGLMPWRGRPEPLKRGLIARVPPLDFTEEMP
jgi:predicted metal-binding protein